MAECQVCHGNHFVRVQPTEWHPVPYKPCPECLAGEVSCCDGDQPSERDKEIDNATHTK